MAERRMFAKTIIDSDAFIDMPITARLLYYDLAMRADDDGFVNSPKKIMRMIGASQDDLNILIMRKFIIPFDNGIVVIKHWRIHNYIRKDMYHETKYKDEKSQLHLDDNNAYTLSNVRNEPVTNSLQVRNELVTNPSTQVRLGKVSIGKNNIYADFENEFDIIWKAYPRKEGKTNALKAYIKARTDKEPVSFETVQEGVKRYIEYIKANNTEQKYIKHGSTWFNQHCWDDDYTISDNSSRPEGYEIIKQEPNDDGGITYHYANGIVRVFDEYNMMIDEYEE